MGSTEKSPSYSHRVPQYETELTQNCHVRLSEASRCLCQIMYTTCTVGCEVTQRFCGSHRAVMHVMLVTCMGRVSCYTCCGQSITVQLRFNWPSVRFLHILLALLHLMFHFLALFFVFLFCLPTIRLAFFYFNLNYLLILSSLSFYPPLFCLLFLLTFLFPPHLQAPNSEKQK
jgi:hypothetical protein